MAQENSCWIWKMLKCESHNPLIPPTQNSQKRVLSLRANTGVTPSLGVLGRNTKKAPSSKLNKCKEICETEYNFKVKYVVLVEKQPKSGPAACFITEHEWSSTMLTHLTPLFSKSDLHEVYAESNRTLSSLKKRQAAVSQRIISGTS